MNIITATILALSALAGPFGSDAMAEPPPTPQRHERPDAMRDATGAAMIQAPAVDPCEIAFEPDFEPVAPGTPQDDDSPARSTRRVPDDRARARTACETARARFGELFGEPVPAIRIVLWDRTGYWIGTDDGRGTVFWPTSEVMASRIVDEAAAERHVATQWSDVLPHESMHALLAARLEALGKPASGGSYGTPLPDWFDEAIAIWAEPLESRRIRLAAARALPDDMRDLRAILTSPHPAAGNTTAFKARDGTAARADDVLHAFYPQSIAVLAFVHALGGDEAVRALARRLIADPADAEAIVGLPGLPDHFADVVEAWRAWLSKEPAGPYAPPDRPTSAAASCGGRDHPRPTPALRSSRPARPSSARPPGSRPGPA